MDEMNHTTVRVVRIKNFEIPTVIVYCAADTV